MYLFGGKFCKYVEDNGSERDCTCPEIVSHHPKCECDRKHFNNILWATVTVFQVSLKRYATLGSVIDGLFAIPFQYVLEDRNRVFLVTTKLKLIGTENMLVLFDNFLEGCERRRVQKLND